MVLVLCSERRFLAALCGDSTELRSMVTQRGISGRLQAVDEHYWFERYLRCPQSATASPPFALYAFPAAAVRRWSRTGGSWRATAARAAGVSKGAQRPVMVFGCCRPDAIAGCMRKATR